VSAEQYARYRRARATLVQYLVHKVDLEDWHGVSDAANDIRVLDAQYEALSKQVVGS
jgi:hypothetical protein